MKLTVSSYRNGEWVPAPPLVERAENTLVVVFGSTSFGEHAPILEEVRRLSAGAVLIGCSTSGEICGHELRDDSLTVAVARFERTTLRAAAIEIGAASESRKGGRELGELLNAPEMRGIFVLSDGLGVNGSELVSGLSDVLPDEVLITGGLAGDGARFERTWVLSESGAAAGKVAAVGFYGSAVRLTFGTKGGWDTFGAERRITRSEGNVLFELDGKPALALYKQYLGERASGLPATALLFPLALKETREQKGDTVRTVLAVDEEKQSLTFAGDMPEGSYATSMRANFDRLIDGAGNAALMALQETQEAVLCLAVSCVGRRLILGERAEEEIEALADVLPPQTQFVGFYSYGEIAPSQSRGCELHNQTMTLTTISESTE